ncbi:double-strand-break repair protein rad21-like protein 1 [Leptodactylus fuscus]|uniref:double-strand-break repair protein rad21-like protein 1 n=1 Tax=Leptodactylus fuscus TaxID=238119 RepID=UPI003F4EA69F
MFYTYLLLGKRGILSKIWIAAHWEKKLTKAHVFECNLESAIQSIMAPKAMIALRTSGHLLLGVVRIYHRKAKYLLADCNEALLNMKISFRPGALDLTENIQEASYNAITLPEEFPDFDIQLPDLNLIDVVDHFTLNQSRVEDITMNEEADRQLSLHHFGSDLDPFRHGSASDVSFEVSANSVLPEQSSAPLLADTRDLFANDLFGDEDAPMDFFDSDSFFNYFNVLAPGKDMSHDIMLSPPEQSSESHIDETQEATMDDVAVANTTLVSNEEIGFFLEPVDVSVIEKKKRSKRKRKLMVDDVKEIPSCRMQEQIMDTSDTTTTLDIAPPTQHGMEWKMYGGVQWLLSHPNQPIINSELLLLFTQIQKVYIHTDIQEEQARPTDKTLEHEEIDLLQLEAKDVSSSITEDPSCITSDLNDCYPSQESIQRGIPNNDEQQWHKRTQNLLTGLRKLKLSGVSSFSLKNLCKNDKRKWVSRMFYSLLVLKKQSAVRMTQSTPYGDITVIPGPTFQTL